MINYLRPRGSWVHGDMEQKTVKIIKNSLIGLFCAAVAAGNVYVYTAPAPDVTENITFYEVPSSSDIPIKPVNINTADMEELMTLPGIGEVKAKAIIEYRELYGGFVSPEEITEVAGIGTVTYERIRDIISIGTLEND